MAFVNRLDKKNGYFVACFTRYAMLTIYFRYANCIRTGIINKFPLYDDPHISLSAETEMQYCEQSFGNGNRASILIFDILFSFEVWIHSRTRIAVSAKKGWG